MRKYVLGVMCLITVLSCNIGIPNSVTIKGKPGIFIPLGSPFKEGNTLGDQIDFNAIKDKMGGSSDLSVNIYNYYDDADSDVQIYMIHYPIVEMQLDISKYMDDITVHDEKLTYTIPDEIATMAGPAFNQAFPGGSAYLTSKRGFANAEDPSDPPFVVSLVDMAKLVELISGNAFGMEIANDGGFANNIEIKIPAFGITDYSRGKVENNKLRFYNETFTTFIPKPKGSKHPNGCLNDKNEIEIFLRLKGACSGTFELGMIFDWISAVIDTSSEPMEGKHTLKNSLRGFLGDDVAFKDVKGYIYVDGIEDATQSDDATMVLDMIDPATGNRTHLVDPAASALTSRKKPVFPHASSNEKFTGPLPQHSLQDPIPLTGVLNSQGESVDLDYEIMIPTWTIYRVDVEQQTSKVITADMVILLRMELEVKTPVPSELKYVENCIDIDNFKIADYVKLDFGNAFPTPGTSDLFFRNSDTADLFTNIDTVTLSIDKLQNDVINLDKLAILIAAKDNSGRVFSRLLKMGDDKKELKFSFNDDFPYPFSPQFEILLEKDALKDYATLAIKPLDPDEPPVFDFNLSIEVKADINISIPDDIK